MKARLLTAAFGAALALAPLTFGQETKPSPTRTTKSEATLGTVGRDSSMSQDMRAAIAWERFKDAAAARQAAIEAKHPTVTYTNSANRTADDKDPQVKDDKAPGAKKDK